MSEKAEWEKFLSSFVASIDELASIRACLASPDAFESLLQSDDQTLSSLNEIEWMHLSAIVDRYSEVWQSWFTIEEFPAIYRQRKSQAWTPSQLPLTLRDFDTPRLLVHVWASWNDDARSFYNYFRNVAREFANRITIRSCNVDWARFAEYFSEEDRTQGICILFYNHGKRVRTTHEYPEENVLCDALEDWVGE